MYGDSKPDECVVYQVGTEDAAAVSDNCGKRSDTSNIEAGD